MNKLILVVAVLLTIFGVYGTTSAQEPLSVEIINIDSYRDVIDTELERLIITEIAYGWPKDPSPTGEYIIGDVRDENDWQLIGMYPKATETNEELVEAHYSTFQVENATHILYSPTTNEVRITDSHDLEAFVYETVELEEQESILELMLPSFTSASSQGYSGYKFPFDSSIDFNIWRHPTGWHNEESNFKAIDFGGIDESTYVIASAPGKITSLCKNKDGAQAFMLIATEDPSNPGHVLNESILYLHFDKKTIPPELSNGSWVKRGQLLGRLVAGGNELNSDCPQYGVGRHSHLTLPHKPFVIDDHLFTTYSNGNLKIIDPTGNELDWNGSTVFNSTQDNSSICDPVYVTTWYPYENCLLTGYHTFESNVQIDPGITLTLDDHSVMDVNFDHNKILINPNGALKLKTNAKLF